MPPPPEGCRFLSRQSPVWGRYAGHPAQYNPPEETLPLPYKYYGQPFFKGFDWETKVPLQSTGSGLVASLLHTCLIITNSMLARMSLAGSLTIEQFSA
eukprot:SM000213S06815  [mRNA]  locus=s213:197929:198691:+ [translate_table: standard]